MFTVILILHILSGCACLVAGSLAVIFVKGSSAHRLSGKVFFYSMVLLVFTAIILAVVKQNHFLLLIGIFALYQNLAGTMILRNKGFKWRWQDQTIHLMGLVNAVFMILQLQLVLVVFGILSLLLAIRSLNAYWKARGQKPPQDAWLKMHMGMMMGAFVSAITAFAVVNMQYFTSLGVPVALVWFAPSLLLVPLSIRFNRKYLPGGIKNEKLKIKND